MTPETRLFFEKAQRMLLEAEATLSIHLNEAAGRAAYLAAFHAAQALISETTGKSVKTHRGVHTELNRLTKDEPRFDPALRIFLRQSYNLKSIADYETGPEAEVSPERAKETIDEAKRFVGNIHILLGS